MDNLVVATSSSSRERAALLEHPGAVAPVQPFSIVALENSTPIVLSPTNCDCFYCRRHGHTPRNKHTNIKQHRYSIIPVQAAIYSAKEGVVVTFLHFPSTPMSLAYRQGAGKSRTRGHFCGGDFFPCGREGDGFPQPRRVLGGKCLNREDPVGLHPSK